MMFEKSALEICFTYLTLTVFPLSTMNERMMDISEVSGKLSSILAFSEVLFYDLV